LQLVWRPDQGPDGGPITARLEAEQVASSQEVMAWIDREKERPLDWDQLPMVRFAVLRGPSPGDPGKEVFHLALSYVDALLDGWSTTSLLAEVLHRYDRILSGAEPAPEELATVSFRDFVAAERRAMADPESGAFWQRELAGVEATDIVRWGEAAEARSGGGGKESMVLLDVPVPRATVTALEGVARQARTAIKHVLLAAHLQVLSLFSGRTLVSSGVESNGRLEEAGGDLALGMHVNILPFCARLAGGRWVDLVRQVFETERHMLPHRRFPLFEIQKQHGGELARVVFNFTHFHVLQRLEGLRGLRVLDADGFDQTNFLLRADFNRNPFTEALQLSLTGSGGWLGKVDLGRLGDAYLHVLKSMARNPAARYERQSFLHPAERHQLRCEWNDTNLPFIAVDALQAVFEVQAARRPTAVALEYGDSRWSYDRLDGASNRLAHHLRRLGVKPEVPVAICLPRGPYLVASVLAVLKAGGAYVPLDPTHPAERVAHLMKDSAAKVLITERPLVGQLPDSGAVTVYLDEAREALLARPRTPVQRLTTASHLAYILYTSGSTGRPKGVAVSHGAAINLCAAMLRKLRFQSSDAMLSLTTLSFDISVLELFLPLSCGARVVITPQSTAMDGLELARLVHASGVTMMQATPATYRFLVDVGWSGGEALTLLCGGEALSLDLARALGERCRALWNVYGPTETTVWSAADRVVPPLHPTGPLAVTIGRGLANTQLYVLDAQGRRTLPGVPGELYIGGHGVARGYWGKPALTAERFLPDPFGGRAGARLYRTGDLVRYLPDGRLEFLRRVDNQLKIQGHRIEPSEVEGVLEAHPQIRQAVVAARSLPSGHRQLVGYLRFEDSTGNPGAAELREVLRQRLPSYMIPATFVTVDRFPVNASGKVDRSRLPAPARPRRTALELQRFLEQLGRLSEAEAQTFLAQRLRE
jgi:amino acid adenylation domain-containing protein